MYFENFDLVNVVTLVKIHNLRKLMIDSKYDPAEIKFLTDGFTKGFEIGYSGNRLVKIKSPNLRLKGIGTLTTLWNKVMKEVSVQQYAGPFSEIPFQFYIQLPIGLVPKDKNDT